jgi:hypothetical protein
MQVGTLPSINGEALPWNEAILKISVNCKDGRVNSRMMAAGLNDCRTLYLCKLLEVVHEGGIVNKYVSVPHILSSVPALDPRLTRR